MSPVRRSSVSLPKPCPKPPYEDSSDEIVFKVNDELSTFGSRDAGKQARNKIENLMDRGRASITFDFSEIHLISSSFADEVFGKMFVALGPIKFGQLCRFESV